MADAVIREGFLCPICMQDLGSVAELQSHFDVAHAEEDKDVLNQLKDFFGKAKQKILNNMKKEKDEDVFSAFSGEGNEPVSDAGRVNAGGIDPTMWEPQEIGATRSYTDGFKRYRDARMDRFVVETNKLIIRLDKLLSTDAPTEANKRKAFEKSVVPWAPDGDVNLCTACGKSFSLTRRRHHCRLCGGIICNRCSHFLPFSYARKLTNPAYQYEGEGFRRSSSTSSLNSILSPEGEPHIRTCQPCRMLLERRDQQTEQRNRKPFVVQLYTKLRMYIDEANQILPKFLEIAESLHKRIYTLGTNDPEDPPTPTALRLQKMIRSYVSTYLQQNMMGLQAIPSEEELAKLQEQKRLEAQQRIEEERRLAAEREKRTKPVDRAGGAEQPRRGSRQDRSPTDSDGTNKDKVQEALGWKPQEINLGNSDDPMIQQINIIRGYVRQAKQAQKWDEVKMLEENLKELQQEYWRQQEAEKRQRAVSEARVGAHGTTGQLSPHHRPNQTANNPQPARKKQSPTHAKPQVSRYSPSKTSPVKGNPQNPFDEDDTGTFDSDETNPFSDNYKEPTQQQTDSQNPFS